MERAEGRVQLKSSLMAPCGARHRWPLHRKRMGRPWRGRDGRVGSGRSLVATVQWPSCHRWSVGPWQQRLLLLWLCHADSRSLERRHPQVRRQRPVMGQQTTKPSRPPHTQRELSISRPRRPRQRSRPPPATPARLAGRHVAHVELLDGSPARLPVQWADPAVRLCLVVVHGQHQHQQQGE